MSASSRAEPSESPSGRRSSRLLLLFSIALAALLLYFSLRKVAWKDVWTGIAGCNLLLLTAGVLISALSYFLRGLRWRVLLNTQEKLPILRVFWANSAGYLGNNVLPARAGEFVRTAMVSSQSSLTKTFVLTTALTERLMDAIVLVLAGTFVLHIVPNKPDWLQRSATPMLLLACAASLLLLSIPFFEERATRLLSALHPPEKLRQRLNAIIEHVAAGVRSFHDPQTFSKFLAFTFAIWALDAYASIALSYALGMPMTLPIALLLIVALAMGSSLPSTPGYVGIYQFVAVTVLTPFHFSRAQAIAYILVAQAGALAVTGVLGGIGLLQFRRMGSPLAQD